MNLTVLHDGSERIRYNDPRIPLYVSRGDLKSLSNMAALCHWHDDVELLMPTEGYLTYNVNGELVSIGKGQAIFVNARQMHYGYSADGTDCRYICITFRAQQLCGNEELAKRYVLPVLSAQRIPYMILDGQQLMSHLTKIDGLYAARPEGYEMGALSEVLAFWQGLFSMVKGRIEEAAVEDAGAVIVRHMLEFIRTHYDEKITLDAIAAAGGVCRSRCCQMFRKFLGVTPNDYLNSFRLEKGMELLRSTTLPVTEIAAACGFGSASYFTEMFTRQKGCPPKEYRKRK